MGDRGASGGVARAGVRRGGAGRAGASTRSLIVNADDFGQSPGVNAGVIRAHEHGIVTSASLMVRWPAAAAAAAYARRRPELSVGLHVDLGEWAFRGGAWRPLYQVVPSGDAAAVRAEVRRQLAAFAALVGRPPTHLDSHQHAHRREPLRSVLRAEGAALGVPVRDTGGGVRYRGDFYGQTAEGGALPGAVALPALLRLLDDLEPGITELGCHPAADVDLDTMYRAERLAELEALCDARLPAALRQRGIRLRSFHGLGRRVGEPR